MKKKNNQFYIKNLVLKDNVKQDFFSLINVEGGVGYYAPEAFKRNCEESNINRFAYFMYFIYRFN